MTARIFRAAREKALGYVWAALVHADAMVWAPSLLVRVEDAWERAWIACQPAKRTTATEDTKQ